MPYLDVLCLANSKKLSGRCIAGIRLDNGQWIRPVSFRDGGCIMSTDYQTSDGNPAQPVKVYSIPFTNRAAKFYHPEDAYYDIKQTWQLIETSTATVTELLNSRINDSEFLIGNSIDRIPQSEISANKPVPFSLQLISPTNAHFAMSFGKPRLIFYYRDQGYSLAITDSDFLNRHRNITDFPISLARLGYGRPIITVSLGEPFQGAYFKLVAAIMNFP